jgi:hypothetical protein
MNELVVNRFGVNGHIDATEGIFQIRNKLISVGKDAVLIK